MIEAQERELQGGKERSPHWDRLSFSTEGCGFLRETSCDEGAQLPVTLAASDRAMLDRGYNYPSARPTQTLSSGCFKVVPIS